jgi:predicted TIM-barrel fold metal-dependent hydrolase
VSASPSARVRAHLDHPIVDSDGHTIEFEPAVLDVLRTLAGPRMVERYRRASGDGLLQWRLSDAERRSRRLVRAPWWVLPAENTLDRATAALPRLLVSRLEEIGLDFSVVYPSLGLVSIGFEDDELRQATCRAFNQYHADLYREHARWLTPAAIIPMHTPREAVAELDHAVGRLGMKVVMMAGAVRRPLPAAEAISPEAAQLASWIDTLGLDSVHDYDPVWVRCVELGVCPTFHTGSQGWGARRSITSFVYNHTGHFAAAGEATCKALFLGGVTRRFPSLRFAFLEGGVAWACSLFADLLGHWQKRNREAVQAYDPAKLDRDALVRLFREHADPPLLARLQDLIDGAPVRGDVVDDAYPLDEFQACGIETPRDLHDLFVPRFYFGCESDDPMNAWAFDARTNPFGAKLHAILGSDIGHWDVRDVREVVGEAFELVERGLVSQADFRAFSFENPVRFWTALAPDFFAGTSVESAARDLLARAAATSPG